MYYLNDVDLPSARSSGIDLMVMHISCKKVLINDGMLVKVFIILQFNFQ